MEKTWRWFGKKDEITLTMLRQIGVEGIVTALHDVPNGEVWPLETVKEMKEYIDVAGRWWKVCLYVRQSSMQALTETG